jgi:hypothetical protein
VVEPLITGEDLTVVVLIEGVVLAGFVFPATVILMFFDWNEGFSNLKGLLLTTVMVPLGLLLLLFFLNPPLFDVQ